jgi:hypothetical protein
MSEYQQEPQTEETPGGAARNTPFDRFLRHEQRAFEETGKALEALLPPGFKEHSQEAGREFVSGLKVLFDAAIDGVQKASADFDKNFNRPASGTDSDDRPSSTGTTKVKVQVE